MTAFDLRSARAEDWPRAWEIQREAFLDLVTATRGGWTEELQHECRMAWNAERTRMVEADGQPIGWVRVEHRPDHDWLDLVVIDRSRHGRGLGAAVMRVLIGEAHARGVPLVLSVYRANPARRLYARLGFVETPRDEVRVTMTLAPPA